MSAKWSLELNLLPKSKAPSTNSWKSYLVQPKQGSKVRLIRRKCRMVSCIRLVGIDALITTTSTTKKRRRSRQESGLTLVLFAFYATPALSASI